MNKFRVHDVVQRVVWRAVIVPGSRILSRLAMGTRVHHAQVVPRSAVVICNHIHPLDVLAVAQAVNPRRVYFSSQQSNFDIPVAGTIMRFFDTIVVGREPHVKEHFYAEATQRLHDGKLVAIYPEGIRGHNPWTMRPLKKGAFELAVRAGVPVLPMRLIPTGGTAGLLWKRTRLDIWTGELLYPDPALGHEDAVQDLRARARSVMDDLLAWHKAEVVSPG